MGCGTCAQHLDLQFHDEVATNWVKLLEGGSSHWRVDIEVLGVDLNTTERADPELIVYPGANGVDDVRLCELAVVVVYLAS